MLNNTTTISHFTRAGLRRAVLLIFLFASMGVFAQVYSSKSPYQAAGQHQMDASVQAAQTYRAYQSTVYEPFNNTAPSEVGQEGSNPELGISNRRNSFIKPGDPNSSDESPIGEPWVMLIFAAAAAVVVAIRGKKQGLSKG
jgi:hypothetical protein